MPVMSIGDMAQQFTSMRNGGAIKSDLAKLAESLSTGKVTDVTQELNGQTTRFSGIRYRLEQLEAFSGTLKETAQYLSNVQTVLGQVDEVRGSTAQRLLLVNESSTIAQVDEAAKSAKYAFEAVVRTLNTQISDRALFSGAQVDQVPLAPAQDMLSNLFSTIPVGADTTTIMAQVDTWFDDPAGGFAISGYLGDMGNPVEKRISESKTIALDARADDPAIVAVLKATAIAAVAEALPSLDQQTKTELLQHSGRQLFVATSDLVAMQAQVGFNESIVAGTLAENTAQTTALGMSQNDLVKADPFETAARLQAVQLQLETHFTVTARMAQLSLLRYI